MNKATYVNVVLSFQDERVLEQVIIASSLIH